MTFHRNLYENLRQQYNMDFVLLIMSSTLSLSLFPPLFPSLSQFPCPSLFYTLSPFLSPLSPFTLSLNFPLPFTPSLFLSISPSLFYCPIFIWSRRMSETHVSFLPSVLGHIWKSGKHRRNWGK